MRYPASLFIVAAALLAGCATTSEPASKPSAAGQPQAAPAAPVAAVPAPPAPVAAPISLAPSSGPVAPPAVPRARTSPHETIGAVIDGTRLTIIYGRPFSARGGQGEKRKIWGTLVPYDKVWRTGADEATLLVVEKPVIIGSASVPAGAYTLWTLPAADGSAKLIINKQVGQWGIDRNGSLRDPKLDLAVVQLTKDTLSSAIDQFTIAIVRNSAGGGGVIKLAWEDTQYSVGVAAAK